MGKLLKILGSLAALGAALSAAVYYLHKRGFLRVEVNYDDKEGQPVTRELDEIVETCVGSAGGKVTSRVAEVASDVRNKIEHELGIAKKELDRSITIPSTLHEESAENK